ncbi:MAG: hypothetical protein WCI05_11250 [Myxococcales bacterium]
MVRLVFAAALLGLVGCGPSFQVVYEGDRRFEQCYALDDDPKVARQAKADCWSRWSHQSTEGQPQDRVSYAHRRYASLASPGTGGSNASSIQPTSTAALRDTGARPRAAP